MLKTEVVTSLPQRWKLKQFALRFIQNTTDFAPDQKTKTAPKRRFERVIN
ncbi:MAG: hypothetical protein K2X55_03470 [Burkholderiaceae bacterium]|nr:hypothetical protein [Burkholderiaceae bacterium]